mgnify:CR=1 FL=1|jgi:hypothetical protein
MYIFIYITKTETRCTMNTQEKDKIEGTEYAWETGLLGQSEEHVKVAGRIDEGLINDALGLQLISIRLQKTLIDDLKLIAKMHGLGYQPLVRQILTRFADAEKRLLLADKAVESAGYIEESSQRKVKYG